MALLNVIIIDLVQFFSLGKNMSDAQIKSTVQLIIMDYAHLKPEDFKLCFNKAKRGEYGKVYDRLDGQVILMWLEEYSNYRADTSEGMNISVHDSMKYNLEKERVNKEDSFSKVYSDYLSRNGKG